MQQFTLNFQHEILYYHTLQASEDVRRVNVIQMLHIKSWNMFTMYVRLYHHSVWIGFTLHSWNQQLRSHIISQTTNSPGTDLSLHRQQQSICSRNFLLLPNLKFITDATRAHSLHLLNNEHRLTTEFSTICFNIIHYGHYPGGLLTWVLSNKNCISHMHATQSVYVCWRM